MKWIDIKDQEPPEDLPVLFEDSHTEAYMVGYWNRTEKCMVSRHHIKDLDGWKYIPSRWAFIYDMTEESEESLEGNVKVVGRDV